MKNLKSRNLNNIFHSKTMLVFMLTLVFAVALLVFSIQPVFALTTGNGAVQVGNGAVQAGNGADLWNNVTNTFNPNVVNDIKSKLFGTINPATYVENNYDKEEFNLSKGKVVTARTINSKVGNAEEGMVVTLGGKQWSVTSLTLADTPNNKNSVIMTLYLTQSEGTSMYSDFPLKIGAAYGSDMINYGADMYSSSTIRNALLTAENWSMFSSGYFAKNYLVQPKYIDYQHNLTRSGRDSGRDFKNDSLGNVINPYDGYTWGWDENENWSSNEKYGKYISYDENTTVNGYRYNDWGEDYIWLPSMTETGALKDSNGGGDSMFPDKCVWKLTPNQRKFSGNSWSWVRSGDHSAYCNAFLLNSSGGASIVRVSSKTVGVRPAIHLNLSAAFEGVANGIAPTKESGYDYQTIDKNNVRQNYATTNSKHSASIDSSSVLGKILPNTKLSTFVANLENSKSSIKVYDSKNNLIYDKGAEVVSNQIIGTGYRVELYNGATAVDKVYLSVLGDVNGDGRITASDVMYLRQIASDSELYNNLNIEIKIASLIINKGKVTSADSEIILNVINQKLTMDLFL